MIYARSKIFKKCLTRKSIHGIIPTMMNNILRFTDYDIFAYLASGVVAIAGWDLLFSTQYVVGAQWSVSSTVLVIIFAYIVGQILASPSAWLIERQLVHRILGRPTESLIRTKPWKGWRGWASRSILSGYYQPLETMQAERLNHFMAKHCIDSTEDLFWRAFPVANSSQNGTIRINVFLRLYGFCRNLTFVALVISGGMLTKSIMHWWNTGWDYVCQESIFYMTISFLTAVGMLYRYLKFHRLFAVEVLVAFVNSLEKEAT